MRMWLIGCRRALRRKTTRDRSECGGRRETQAFVVGSSLIAGGECVRNIVSLDRSLADHHTMNSSKGLWSKRFKKEFR
jgi:hypothetical protein